MIERRNKIFHMMIIFKNRCPGGEIGRHKGLKIPRRKLRAGSSPALGTITIPTMILLFDSI